MGRWRPKHASANQTGRLIDRFRYQFSKKQKHGRKNWELCERVNQRITRTTSADQVAVKWTRLFIHNPFLLAVTFLCVIGTASAAVEAPATAPQAVFGLTSLIGSLFSLTLSKLQVRSPADKVAKLSFTLSSIQSHQMKETDKQVLLEELRLAKANLATSQSTGSDATDFAIVLATSAGVVLGAIFVAFIFNTFVIRLLASKFRRKPITPLQKELMKASPTYEALYVRSTLVAQHISNVESGSLGNSIVNSALLSTITALGSIGVTFGASFANIAAEIPGNVFSVLTPVVGSVGLMVAGYTTTQYTDTIFSFLVPAWQCYIRPLIFDYILLPVYNIVFTLFPMTVYGLVLYIAKLMNLVTWGPIRVLLTFAFDTIGIWSQSLAGVFSGLVAAFVHWIKQGPSLTNFPFYLAIQPALQFVSTLWGTTLLPSCYLLNYVVGGIFASFGREELADSLSALLGLVFYTIQQLLIQPVFYGQPPMMEGFNDLSESSINGMGMWIQNFTVVQFDIWIGGDIIGKVNGTVPVPDTNEQYLIRFLRSQWAQAVGWVASFLLSIVWETLRIIFYAKDWLNPHGAPFWTFEMSRTSAVAFVDSTATIINTLPQCVVSTVPQFDASQNIQFGGIVSGLGRAIIALAYIVKDLFFGELYSLVAFQNFPGFFASSYFIANGAQLQEFTYQINVLAQSTACAIALLDPGIGQFIAGAINVVLNWAVRVIIEILSLARYALETKQPEIMNELDNSPTAPLNVLEAQALQIANVATFLYRFENADATICATRLSFFCGLGKVVESAVQLLIRAFLLLLRTAVNIIRAFVTLVTTGTIGNISPLDIQSFVNTAYTLGCRTGTTLSNIIPFQLTCHSSRANFCAVKEFNPVPSPQNPTICLSTVACRIGNYFGVIFDLAATFLQFGNQILWSLGSGNFVSESNKALVVVLRTILNIFVYKILSPLCPFAHYIDCWLDVLTPGLGAPVSQLLCLINSFAIVFINILGETVIKIVELFIYVLQVFFGGATVGQLVTILKLAFEILGTFLQQFFLAVAGIVLQFLVPVFEAVCKVICFFDPNGGACTGCNSFVANLKGQADSFFNPSDSSNYLRKRATRQAQYDTAAAQISVNLMRAFGMLYVQNMTLANGTTIEVEVERVIDKTQLPTHLATYVWWTHGSNCQVLFSKLNGTSTADVENNMPAEFMMMQDCIRMKALRVVLADTSPMFAWIPEDAFYNPVRWIVVLANILRYMVVFANYVSDKYTPHDTLMSNDYIQLWAKVGVDTTHYYDDFAPIYPGPNLTESAYANFTAYVKNVTWDYYEKLNFPDLYSNNASSARGAYYFMTYSQAFQSTYLGIGSWMYTTLDSQYNYSVAYTTSQEAQNILNGVDNVTGLQMTDGSFYSLSNVYTFGNVSNIRATIFNQYGDEYVSVFDERQTTIALYSTLNQLMLSVFDFASTAATAYGGSVDFHELYRNDNYLGADSSTIGGNSTTTTNPPSSPPQTLFKRYAEEYKHEKLINDYRKRYATIKPTEETKQRAQRIHQDYYQRWNQTRTEGNKKSWLTTIFDGLWAGYATMVDDFMVANGVAKESDELKKKRSVTEQQTTAIDSVYSRSQTSRVLIAVVGAASSALKLNTTYTPRWCDSHPTSMACNVSDWRHILNVFAPNETEIANWTAVNLPAWGSAIESVFAPKSETARAARSFVQNIGAAAVQYTEEVWKRVSEQIDHEDIQESINRVMGVYSGDSASKAPPPQTGQTVEEILTATASSPEDLKSVKIVGLTNPRIYVPYKEQKRRAMEWYNNGGKELVESAFKVNNDSTSTVFSELANPDSDWTRFLQSYTLADPAKMKPAIPGSRSMGAMDLTPGTSISNKILRAYVRSLHEERAIADDYDNYVSLFTADTYWSPETAATSHRVAVDGRSITVKSITKNRELYRALTGMEPPKNPKALPTFEIRGFTQAVLKKVAVTTTRRLPQVEGAEANSESVVSETKYHYEMLYSQNPWRSAASETKLIQSINEQIKSQEHPIDVYKNVVEIRIVPSKNEFGVEKDSVLGAQATVGNLRFGTFYFFPTDEADTIDIARRTLGCQLGNAWLCANCTILDYLVGTFVKYTLSFVSYYTMYYPGAFIATSQWLSYGYSGNSTVQIGYGTFPPRYPALGVPTGYWYRAIQREVDNFPNSGPQWSWFFEDAIAVPLPTYLMLNGSFNVAFQAYIDAKAAALPSFQVLPVFEFFIWVQDTFGWNIPALFDTILFFVENNYSKIVTWIYNKWRCNWTTNLDCTIRTYSYVGGYLLLVETYAYIFGFLYLTVGSSLATAVLVWLILITPWLHSLITYGWAAGCYPFLPQCYPKDTWDALAYTFFPKCPIGFGGFINTTNWDLNTCTSCENVESIGRVFYNQSIPNGQFGYLNCRDYGFNTAYDGLTVLNWYSTAYGLQSPWFFNATLLVVNTLNSLLNTLGIQFTTLTRDWSSSIVQNNWRSSDPAYANYYMCGVVSSLYGVGATSASFFVAYAVALPFIKQLPTIVAFIFVFIGTLVYFVAVATLQSQMQLSLFYNSFLVNYVLAPDRLDNSIFRHTVRQLRKTYDFGPENAADDDEDDDDEDDDDATDDNRLTRAQKRDKYFQTQKRGTYMRFTPPEKVASSIEKFWEQFNKKV